MQLKGQTIGFKGEYAIKVLDKDGNEKEYINNEKTIRSGEPIKNALLDTFFQLLHTTDNNLTQGWIRCGSGTGAVDHTQTTLEQQISLNNGNWPSAGAAPYNTEVEGSIIKIANQYKFTFAIGQIEGNISELGAMFTNGSTLHSRALVEDSQGQPATITITRDEQLVIIYKLNAEASVDDVVQNVPVMINGVATDTEVICRWAQLSAINISNIRIPPYMVIGFGELKPALEKLVMAGSATMENSTGQSVPDARRYNSTIAASKGNYDRMIEIAACHYITSVAVTKYQFTPPLPKNADRTLTISLDYSFGRI